MIGRQNSTLLLSLSAGIETLSHELDFDRITKMLTVRPQAGSDILVRKLILVRVLIQFDKNNFSLVLILVRQKMKILVLVQF